MEENTPISETDKAEATAPLPEANQPAQDPSTDTASDCCEKYRKAFEALWPDSQGVVHKEKLKEFFRSSLNALYCDDMANCLIDMMKPDENGHITIENLIHAFSLAYWTPESVAAMHDVLKSNPDIINRIADWKSILKTLGVQMTDAEVDAVIEQARARATDLLSAELDKASDLIGDKDEVIRKSSEILDTIRARISEMEITEQATSQVQIGGEPVQVSGEPVQVGGEPVQLGGEPVQLGGEPVQLGGEPDSKVIEEPVDTAETPIKLVDEAQSTTEQNAGEQPNKAQ